MATAIYLRFGSIPDGGRSECHTLTQGQGGYTPWAEMTEEERAEFEAAGYVEVDGTVYEPGVSAFGLVDPDDDELVFGLARCYPADLESYMDRPAFLVTGERLDSEGASGEPLLANTELVGAVEVVEVAPYSIRVRRAV